MVTAGPTREPLDPNLGFSYRLAGECLKKGLYIPAGSHCDRGQAGDMIIFSPPFVTTTKQMDEMVDLFDEALTTVEKEVAT